LCAKIRAKNAEFFYHGHKEDCTPHTVKAMALHEIALGEIKRVTEDAREHTEQFLQRAMDKHQSQLKKDLSAKSKELDRANKRLADLDKLFRKVFEELTLENPSGEQFQMLTQGYAAEKQELSTRAATLDNEISTQQDKLLNADRFLAIVDKYTDIRELTPEIVREFIDRIVVHERSEPYKKKNYTQEVEVYFNFVGKV
jgi:translation initiation factor 2B subunit (eIF-2B alpha/beta/delta family)